MADYSEFPFHMWDINELGQMLIEAVNLGDRDFADALREQIKQRRPNSDTKLKGRKMFGPQPISNMAISFSDYQKFGCPVCLTGEKGGFTLVQFKGTTLFSCSHCKVAYTVCADGLTETQDADHTPVTPHPKGENHERPRNL